MKLKFKQRIRKGKKEGFNVTWLFVSAGLSISEAADLLGSTENGPKMRNAITITPPAA